MNRKKKTLLCAIILIALCLIIVFTSKVIKKTKLANIVINDPLVPDVVEARKNNYEKIMLVDDRGALYNVRSCLQRFFMQCNLLSTDEYNDSDINYLMNMISNDYIESEGITKDNLVDKLKLEEESTVYIYEIYVVSKFEDVYTYFVKGTLKGLNNNSFKDFNAIVNLDTNNQTFNISLDNPFEKYNIIVGESVEYEIPDSIYSNNANKYYNSSATTEEFMNDYFYMIKNLLLNNISQAYHMLENGSNYGSINELESFYSENINSILAMAYGTYEVYNVEGDVVIYRIYDKKAKIYVDIYVKNYSNLKYNIGLL